MDYIYHSALTEQWEDGKSAGEYRQSTREVTLEQEGFIHCSYLHQLERTLNKYYKDVERIELLEIDPALVKSEIIDELAPAAGQSFPHIYGPISIAAVVRVITWERSQDGKFSLGAIGL